MEDLTFKVSPSEFRKLLLDALPKIFVNIMNSKESPLITAVEDEIASKDGVFRELIRDIVTELTTSPEFKKELRDKLSEHFLQKMSGDFYVSVRK